MTIFDTQLWKYEILWMPLILFERSFGYCYEHFKTKNVVHSAFFLKILIEIQCIDWGNDQFWYPGMKIWNFLKASNFVWTFSWHRYEHLRTKNVVHSTCFPKIVMEIQCIDCGNDHFWYPVMKIWNFLIASIFVLNFQLGTVMNILGPKM